MKNLPKTSNHSFKKRIKERKRKKIEKASKMREEVPIQKFFLKLVTTVRN